MSRTMKGRSSSTHYMYGLGLHDPGPLEEGVEADEPAGPHKRIRGKSSGAGDVVVLSKAMIFEDKQYQERAEQILKVWSQEEAEEFVEGSVWATTGVRKCIWDVPSWWKGGSHEGYQLRGRGLRSCF